MVTQFNTAVSLIMFMLLNLSELLLNKMYSERAELVVRC